MKLDRVTLTGADDSVSPSALLEISRQFPFVEWGVLFGGPIEGSVRFPSVKWVIEDLLPAKVIAEQEGGKMDLCAHLCGRFVMLLLQEGKHFLDIAFERSQINTHGIPLDWYGNPSEIKDILNVVQGEWGGQFIFQHDGENNEIVKQWVEAGLGVPLFDTSSGAGLTPSDLEETWPTHFGEDKYCGYAGGLGPDNVVEQLELIESKVPEDGRIWIDMETKLFTKGKFDLDKCVDVLSQVEPFIS